MACCYDDYIKYTSMALQNTVVVYMCIIRCKSFEWAACHIFLRWGGRSPSAHAGLINSIIQFIITQQLLNNLHWEWVMIHWEQMDVANGHCMPLYKRFLLPKGNCSEHMFLYWKFIGPKGVLFQRDIGMNIWIIAPKAHYPDRFFSKIRIISPKLG